MSEKKKEVSMRDALGDALAELGAELKELCVVGADTTGSLKLSAFGSKYPERMFNVGIAEQNMIGVSAGLALSGKKVACGSYAVFVPGRAVDQIRNTVAYLGLDVKIVGSHGGLSTGPDGGSHQALEDIAIMRSMANMKVIAPSDYLSTYELVKQAVRETGPYYIRLARPSSEPVYEADSRLRVGKPEVLQEGADVTIAACGLLVQEALKAHTSLKAVGVSSRIVDVHTIKPLDSLFIEKCARETGAFVTAEDHNIHGGLGSAISECVAEAHPVKVIKVGVADRFGESGEPAELYEKYGLTERNITQACLKAVREK